MLCFYCKKEFVSHHGNTKFCSKNCRSLIHTVKHKKICSFCNKKFIGRKNQKFCTLTCSASSRADHLNKIHEVRRKYPKIEGLNFCQVYRRFNPEKGREELSKDNIKRVVLIQYLGGKCAKCGYQDDIRALQLDHIKGDGFKDRKEKNKAGKVYRYYTKNLEECIGILQVLCANCHAIKSIENREHDKRNAVEYRKINNA